MHTLYGYKGSGSAAVEAALEIANVPFKLISAASWDAASFRDQLAKVNPLQQIPTLVLPDGTVLSESAAILIHLAIEHPAARLLPQDASARARAIRGLVHIAANCYSAISIIDYPERWLATPSEEAKTNLRDGTRTRLHVHWDIFASSFEPNPFLSGRDLGVLDLLAAVVSKWSGARKHLQSSAPKLAACLAEVERHERVAPVFARHWKA